jgi:hypothetical protein
LEVPPELALDLPIEVVAGVSSTAARNGSLELMAPAARRFATDTGAWIDPVRYERWLAANEPGQGAAGSRS